MKTDKPNDYLSINPELEFWAQKAHDYSDAVLLAAAISMPSNPLEGLLFFNPTDASSGEIIKSLGGVSYLAIFDGSPFMSVIAAVDMGDLRFFISRDEMEAHAKDNMPHPSQMRMPQS